MTEDHTQGPMFESTRESLDMFTTGNYGVTTNSQTEWLFVRGTDELTNNEILPTSQRQARTSLAAASFAEWPSESREKMPNRDECRQRRPLAELDELREPLNQKLGAINQPALLLVEVIAANLYTGEPCCD